LDVGSGEETNEFNEMVSAPLTEGTSTAKSKFSTNKHDEAIKENTSTL